MIQLKKTWILSGILLGIAFGCRQQNEKTNDKADEKQPDKPLAMVDKFDFEDLEGNKFDWNTTKGKLVFVNFWATWCKPCIKEMPSISEAQRQLPEVIFVVASDESPEKILKYATKHHFSFELMRSNTSVFDLDVKALPTTLIINENGKIVFNEIGARDWANEKNIELIKKFSAKYQIN